MPRDKKSPHPFDVALGSAIRSARVRRRVTREVLAQRTAIPLSNLRRREDGLNETTVSELARIAAVLDIPTREIVDMALADFNGGGTAEDGLRKLVASVSEPPRTVDPEDEIPYIGPVVADRRHAAYTETEEADPSTED
ncbi:hypothetical protein CSIV_05175 [Microbacterium sp. CSI-V]|uniref:helix-turn-helix domain-containing protein n=1 Tax=Microbacterium sp. CSI-V TaxID=1933777 RepID=UPI00097C32F6|nr:helix-turn-helix domain-containing protein [Microbacterium sp. CSI-V]ONI65672.1 hypothetical protein CSIV_05175 [Microbacterium sp. CSI-V]